MKGIIFVVWEKYLGERFGAKFMRNYRGAIGESETDLNEAIPLAASRSYSRVSRGLSVQHHR